MTASKVMPGTAAEQLTSIRSGSLEDKVNYLLDRAAIVDLVQRYGQATDTHDWTLYRTCYRDEIEVDHSPTIGGGLFTISADKWCGMAEKFHGQLDGDEHIMVPQSIVIDGDKASCHVLMHASHYYRKANGSPYQSIAGTYDMNLVRTKLGWKITGSVQKVHFAEGNWQFHEEIKNSLGDVNNT